MTRLIWWMVLILSVGTPAFAQPERDASAIYLGVTGTVSRETAGSGSPEGVVTGPVGSRYVDITTGLTWRKASGTGNTGWIAELSLSACGTSGQFLRSTGAAWGCSTLRLPDAASAGDLLYGSASNTVSMLTIGATEGMFLRRTSGGLPGWSTLVLPNAGTANAIPYFAATNTLGESANFTYNGTLQQILTATDGSITLLRIRNTSTGTSARASLQFGNDASSAIGNIQALGSGFATTGYSFANGLTVASTGAGGTSIVATNASGGDVRVYTRGSTTASVTFGASQTSAFGGTTYAPTYSMGTSPNDVGMRIGTAGDSYITWDGGTVYPQGFRFQYNGSSSSALTIETTGRVHGHVGFVVGASTTGTYGRRLYSDANYVFLGGGSSGLAILDTAGNSGMIVDSSATTVYGQLTVSNNLLYVLRTSEQMRLGYDGSNYFSTMVGSTGEVTLNAVGAGSAFTFSDQVNANADVQVANGGSYRFGDSGTRILGESSGDYIRFDVGGAEGARLTSTGFGIGTTAPTTALDVNGVTTFRSDADPYTNYTSNLGDLNKKYLTLHAAELWVETLVAQDVMATIGGRIVTAPTTQFVADVSSSTTGGLALVDVPSATYSGVTRSGSAECEYNGVLAESCWHTDSSTTGATITWDFNTEPDPRIALVGVYASGGTSAAVWKAQYSDDGSSWSDLCTMPSLSVANSWQYCYAANLTTHRYWRIYLTNTPGGGTWQGEARLYEAVLLNTKHNNFTTNDIVRMESNGKIEFMAAVSAPSGSPGDYDTYVVRDLDLTGANEWYAGDAMVNTGVAGDGFIDQYSVSGVYSGYGPTIVGNVRTAATAQTGGYALVAPRWAIGNLNGLYGYATDIYGSAFGAADGENATFDATNGIRFRTSTTTLGQLTSSVWTLGNTSTENVRITSTAIELRDGSTVFASLDATNLTIGRTAFEHLLADGASLQFKDGSTVYTDLTAGVLTLGNTSTENTRITSTAVELRDGSTVWTKVEGGAVTVGQVASGQSNVYITGGAVELRNNTTTRIKLNSDGSGYLANSSIAWDTSGNLTVSANATIGGWSIGSDYIRDTTGTVGMSSAVTGGDDIRYWAGDATMANAEFRVTEAGALTASNATITSASGTITLNSSGIAATIGTSGIASASAYRFTPNVESGTTYGVYAFEPGGGLEQRFLEVANLGTDDTSVTTWLKADNSVASEAIAYVFTCESAPNASDWIPGTTTQCTGSTSYAGMKADVIALTGAISASSTITATSTIRSNSGFNINGTAGHSATCNPTGGNITVSGGLVTGCVSAEESVDRLSALEREVIELRAILLALTGGKR